jgi:Zn-dependent peptidase ImmA (M78 family)/transcriptional regulator with XRE-family HTH domain
MVQSKHKMPAVNTKILIWARETSGLSVEEVTTKLGWKSSKKILEIESGQLIPSRGNLVKFAEIYRKPLLLFYLSEPPRSVQPAKDFRMLSDANVKSERILETLVNDVKARQEMLASALEEADDAVPLEFVGSIRTAQKPVEIALLMAKKLGFSGADYVKAKSVEEAFRQLRLAVELSGVFVVLANNLGSHHTDLDVTVFRGFALVDAIAPIIVINPKDSKSAWAFTLIHELTHIWIGQSALSSYRGKAAVEKFCDEVAANFLLNIDHLKRVELDRSEGIKSLSQTVSLVANEWNLSRKMIAFNLLDLGRISGPEYAGIVAVFDRQRVNQAVEIVDESSGPSYYVVRRHRLGKRLVSVVERLVSGGILSTTKAGKILGVKPTAVFKTIESRQAA